ncbi:GNAT family N-acetyltransferase [Oceanotoga teriensis]|jgi:ribosomal protein S18 acetylase RimI-like enzyme|uniref:GNAT family N-acetyltransferase n=1 Tax=Oceanotoga teriensis TaxID=515440 RepID=UPI002713587D|nr:GNAT family N-acetyltransferase [Oceanotoga teriensis]MDO7977605.1 GNAT family N-acetyltransferase [Oceanotoga teriensis]
MNIRIEKLKQKNLNLFKIIESKFISNFKVVPKMKDSHLYYDLQRIDQYEKSYSFDFELEKFITMEDRCIYFAFLKKEIVGSITLKKSWNNFVNIMDIRVSSNFRNIGIGNKLIQSSKIWAKMNNCSGLFVETQNTNYQACKFYESLGFKLKGFDELYYIGFENYDEIALFWYLLI